MAAPRRCRSRLLNLQEVLDEISADTDSECESESDCSDGFSLYALSNSENEEENDHIEEYDPEPSADISDVHIDEPQDNHAPASTCPDENQEARAARGRTRTRVPRCQEKHQQSASPVPMPSKRMRQNDKSQGSAAKRRPEPKKRLPKWVKEDYTPPEIHFTCQSGINCPIPDSIMGFTQLFCLTEDDMNLCAIETNRYAAEFFNDNPMESLPTHSRLRAWVETDIEEMKLFFAIVIAMGLTFKPKLSDYWTVDPLMCTPGFGEIMTRNRFELLLRFFHLADNSKAVPKGNEGYDPIYKLREIFDRYSERLRNVYSPECHIAVDEGTIPWKGNLSYRVYNPKKPIKFGVKIYMLCESTSGYIAEWQIYTGQSEGDEHGKTHKLIMDLTERFKNKGHRLYMDRYYNSPQLCEDLYKVKIGVTGTVVSIRKGLPPIQQIKLKKGELVCFHKDEVLVCKWKDKRDILMISTITNCKLVKTGKQNRKTKEDILKPKCVLDYNRYMGGVDINDQLGGYYYLSRKTMKSWKKIAFHCLNSMISNAYIIYKKYSNDKPLKSHYNFSLQLVKELVTSSRCMRRPNDGQRRKTPQTPRRLLDRHFPQHNIRTEKQLHPRRICVVCSSKGQRKESVFCCPECRVGLCVPVCFEMYHTRLHYDFPDHDEDEQ